MPTSPPIDPSSGVPASELTLPPRLHRPRAVARALAVAECLFMSEAGPPPAERLTWLGRELDDFLERSGPDGRTGYLAALFALSLLAPLVGGQPRSLAAMPLEVRAQVLSRVEQGFASGLLLAVKAMLCIIYYEEAGAAQEIGFDGRCLVDSQAASERGQA
ncbi:MAG: hypothetical protein KIT72_14350 [Polyangiaceae bacterium]|nr:hypothetical protein [Polyangiaceae bacterium]MCW5791595.1 hypothetical protein [Polyangiaceae bacterium]